MSVRVNQLKGTEMLRKDENVYQDDNSGAWIAEVLLYPNDPENSEWYRLGSFGTKEAATKACVTSRSVLSNVSKKGNHW